MAKKEMNMEMHGNTFNPILWIQIFQEAVKHDLEKLGHYDFKMKVEMWSGTMKQTLTLCRQEAKLTVYVAPARGNMTGCPPLWHSEP